jgi:hypothetical protein
MVLSGMSMILSIGSQRYVKLVVEGEEVEKD